MSKLIAFVSCTLTQLSSGEPLPIYSFQWTTDLQSTVTKYHSILCVPKYPAAETHTPARICLTVPVVYIGNVTLQYGYVVG